MPDKILLIDGHNLLFRMFYGIPAIIPGKKLNTVHGILGFLSSLLKINNQFKPTHLLVTFDSPLQTFRHETRREYKQNRIQNYSELPQEENPFSQLPGIKKVLNYLNWSHCEIPGFEADDIIAGFSNKYHRQHKITIISTDSDLLQLVKTNVSVYRPHGKQSMLYTPRQVRQKYNLRPNLLPDLKALVGDPTDNISGIPGVGPKTATRLIQQHGNIQKIYSKTKNIHPPNLRDKIKDHQSLVKENLSLIKLNNQIKLPHTLTSLRVKPTSWQHKTMDILKKTKIT